MRTPRWSLGGFFGAGADYETTVTLGAANLLDEDPPHVAVAGSYDPRLRRPPRPPRLRGSAHQDAVNRKHGKMPASSTPET